MNTADIRAWLEGLGLSRYAAAFEALRISPEEAQQLGDEELAEIGVASLGRLGQGGDVDIAAAGCHRTLLQQRRQRCIVAFFARVALAGDLPNGFGVLLQGCFHENSWTLRTQATISFGSDCHLGDEISCASPDSIPEPRTNAAIGCGIDKTL